MLARIGLFLHNDLPVHEAIRQVRFAETRGFRHVFQAETWLARDPLVTVAAYAAQTNRIALGTGGINIGSHNVAALAAALLTLDDLAPDRIICGLGMGAEAQATRVGIQRDRPLIAMRETVQALRQLFALERVTLHGQHIHLSDVQLDVSRSRKAPRRIPIYIAAAGPAMIALAGEIADGLLLNYLVSPAYTEAAVAQLEAGLDQSGRRMDAVERAQLIVCSVDRDRHVALDRARLLVARYLYEQPSMMRASGVSQALIDDLTAAVSRGTDGTLTERLRRSSQLVPDSIVQQVTAAGSPEECVAAVKQYVAAGATYPVIYPLGQDPGFVIDTFATHYQRESRYA